MLQGINELLDVVDVPVGLFGNVLPLDDASIPATKMGRTETGGSNVSIDLEKAMDR